MDWCTSVCVRARGSYRFRGPSVSLSCTYCQSMRAQLRRRFLHWPPRHQRLNLSARHLAGRGRRSPGSEDFAPRCGPERATSSQTLEPVERRQRRRGQRMTIDNRDGYSEPWTSHLDAGSSVSFGVDWWISSQSPHRLSSCVTRLWQLGETSLFV